MKQNVFRDSALQRLSSPDQLDQLIRITSPRAWLALLAAAVLIAGTIAWSFIGSLSTKVHGYGILLNNGGVYHLVSHSTGQVTDMRFGVGDIVNKGDVVARIDQPVLVQEINNLRVSLGEMAQQDQTSSAEYQKSTVALEKLRSRLSFESQIISQIDGRVLEQNVNKNSFVSPGSPILILEQYGPTVRLEGILYVSAAQAGNIHPGMDVHIAPSFVSKEEYGLLLGKVSSVAKYPETAQSMMQTLENENLVSQLAGNDAPVRVLVELLANNDTESGYAWSSPAGPPSAIPSGTLVQGDIIIKRERPIGKVLPFLSGSSIQSGDR